MPGHAPSEGNYLKCPYSVCESNWRFSILNANHKFMIKLKLKAKFKKKRILIRDTLLKTKVLLVSD